MSSRPPTPVLDRPAGVIDRLDGAFMALRQRARTIVTVVLALVAPASLLEAWVTRDVLGGVGLVDLMEDPALAQEASNPASTYDAGFFLSTGVNLLVVALAGVAVGRIVAGWHEGRDVGPREALGFTVRRLPTILAAFVLIHLMELVGMLLVLPGLAALVLCCLTSPVLAAEDLGAVAAIRRSATLVRRRLGPTVGTMVLLGVVEYAVSQAISTIPSLGIAVIGFDRGWPLLAATTLVVSLITIPVTTGAMALTYFDIRFRTEGLDLRRRLDTDWPR